MKKETKTIKKDKPKQNNVPLIISGLALLSIVGYAAVRDKPVIDTSGRYQDDLIEDTDYVEVETSNSTQSSNVQSTNVSTTSDRLVYLDISKGRFSISTFYTSFLAEIKANRFSNAISMFEALNQHHVRYFHNRYLKSSKKGHTFYEDIRVINLSSVYKTRLIKVLEKHGVGKVIKTRI